MKDMFYHCACGIVLDLDKLKSDQYNVNAPIQLQSYKCLVCKRSIKEDEDEVGS